jgi:ABC-type polar amino acid transport system ATPase subunit
VVKVEGLTKRFGVHTLFKDLTLEFPHGGLTVIMGPSGCGKSTLLRCINFLEFFDSGSVSIGDLSVSWESGEAGRLSAEKRMTVQKMRLKTGMVFQGFNLFPHLTVLENVTLAPTQVKRMNSLDANRLGKRILERVGLGDKMHVYPSKLSGGQQQRVGIARSLAMQPEVMLYDEPTSQLDPQLVDEVFGVMRELDKEGMTQIVVTHYEEFATETSCKLLRFAGGTFQWSTSDTERPHTAQL